MTHKKYDANEEVIQVFCYTLKNGFLILFCVYIFLSRINSIVLYHNIAKDLIDILMDDYQWDMQKCMDVLYTSETFAKLEDERTGLYYQGAVYVYEYLKNELEMGAMV